LDTPSYTDLRNVSILPQNFRTSQPTRQRPVSVFFLCVINSVSWDFVTQFSISSHIRQMSPWTLQESTQFQDVVAQNISKVLLPYTQTLFWRTTSLWLSITDILAVVFRVWKPVEEHQLHVFKNKTLGKYLDLNGYFRMVQKQ